MMAARRSPDGTDIPKRAGWILNRTLKGGEAHILDRGDYRYTLDVLDRVAASDKVFLTTYEGLFEQAELDRLCDWLGLSPAPAKLDWVIHKGPAADMPEHLAQRAAEALTPQYDYIGDRLGGLPSGWLPVGRHAATARLSPAAEHVEI